MCAKLSNLIIGAEESQTESKRGLSSVYETSFKISKWGPLIGSSALFIRKRLFLLLPLLQFRLLKKQPNANSDN